MKRGKITNFLNSLWNSKAAEQIKGGIKGQAIRVRYPKRYKELKKIRGEKRSILTKENKKIADTIRDHLKSRGIEVSYVSWRVKTLGSIDRKAKVAIKKFKKEQAEEYMKSDILGIEIITKTESDYKTVIDSLREIGEFFKTSFGKNPREYYYKGTKTTEPVRLIVANFRLKGSQRSVHLRIISKHADKINRQTYRTQYKKELKKLLKEK